MVSYLQYQKGFANEVVPKEIQTEEYPETPGPLLVVPETPLGALGATVAICAAFGLLVIAKKRGHAK